MPRELVGVVIFRERTRPAAPAPATPAKRPSTGSASSSKPTKERGTEIPENESDFTPSDTEYDEVEDDKFDVKQTSDEGEAEVIGKRFADRAKTDENGERVFKGLILVRIGYDNASYTLTGMAFRLASAERWTSRLRHSVKYRIKLAKGIDISKVPDSSFCFAIWRLFCQMDDEKAEKFIAWINSHIPELTRAGLGIPIVTGEELLNLPPFDNQSFLLWMGTYFLIILDENRRVVAIYPGSECDPSSPCAKFCNLYPIPSREYSEVVAIKRHNNL